MSEAVSSQRDRDHHRLANFSLGNRGTGALEFSIIAAVFFSLLLGGIEVARYLVIVQSLRNVTAEATRAALIAYNGGTSYNATTVKGLVPFLNAAQLTLTVSPTPPSCTAHLITANASYPFVSVIPIFASENNALTTANFSTQISC